MTRHRPGVRGYVSSGSGPLAYCYADWVRSLVVPARRRRCQTRCRIWDAGERLMSASVTATFVFTDLVDSTATAARLGPAAAEELRQTHFRLLRGAAAASGGT